MAETNHQLPYKILGTRLRVMREKLQESLAEVSGAVEIEPDMLTLIEQGKDRPSEDILLLLISHFAVKEDEATKLWELAGYDQSDTGTISMSANEFGDIKNTVMVMPIDARIVYTDMAHIMVNEHGVVMNFMQTGGPDNQPLAVGRLGMSREHAKSVLELLQKTLEHTEPKPQKALPESKSKQDADSKKSENK